MKYPIVTFCLALVMSQTSANDFFSEVDVVEPVSTPSNNLLLNFEFQQTLGYGFRSPELPNSREESGVNRLQSDFLFTVDWQLPRNFSLYSQQGFTQDFTTELRDEDFYSQQEQEDKEFQWQARENWVQYSNGGFWVRGGNQQAAWGQTETMNVLDLNNPVDNRWLGQRDLDDSRVSVLALETAYQMGSTSLGLWLAGTEAVNEEGVEGSEFDRLAGIRHLNLELEDQEPDQAYEWLLKLAYSGEGYDLAVIGGQTVLDDYYLSRVQGNQFGPTGLEFSRPETAVIGFQANQVLNSWLIKTEWAYFERQHQRPDGDAILSPWPESEQALGSLGFEYSGFSDTQISLEWNLDYLEQAERLTAYDRSDWASGAGLRLNRSFFNERSEASAVVVALPSHLGLGSNGIITRLEWSQDLSDTLFTGVKLIDYSAPEEESDLHAYRNNDAIIVWLAYKI